MADYSMRFFIITMSISLTLWHSGSLSLSIVCIFSVFFLFFLKGHDMLSCLQVKIPTVKPTSKRKYMPYIQIHFSVVPPLSTPPPRRCSLSVHRWCDLFTLGSHRWLWPNTVIRRVLRYWGVSWPEEAKALQVVSSWPAYFIFQMASTNNSDESTCHGEKVSSGEGTVWMF